MALPSGRMADDMAWCPPKSRLTWNHSKEFDCGQKEILCCSSGAQDRYLYRLVWSRRCPGADKGIPGRSIPGVPDPGRSESVPAGITVALSDASLFEDEAHVVVYTDGGAIGNPGPGGYGVVIALPRGGDGRNCRAATGGRPTTVWSSWPPSSHWNPWMTVCPSCCTAIHATWWMPSIKSGCLAGKNEGGKKRTAIRPRIRICGCVCCSESPTLRVIFRWVKGHAGHQWNERCDELAGQAMARSNLPADIYFESLSEEPAALTAERLVMISNACHRAAEAGFLQREIQRVASAPGAHSEKGLTASRSARILCPAGIFQQSAGIRDPGRPNG